MVVSVMREQDTAVYSSARGDYTALTEGAGLLDRSHIGRLSVGGTDAIDLLNRLSTNKLDDLAVGDVMGTVLTTNKGRIIDLLYALRRDDDLLVLTGPDTRQRVAEWIDFYTFIEDVTIEDATDDTAMLSLVGPDATAILPALADVPLYGSSTLAVGGIETLAIRTDFAGTDGYDLIAQAENVDALWDALADMGAAPVGADALRMSCIMNGVSGYGSELTEDYNPLEAGLIRFISFNKGCYIGQEVVARLNTYDKVQRHLVRLSWDADDAPELPVALLHDSRNVGAVTTAATALDGDGCIGLGYVRKAHVDKGTRLLTESGMEVMVEGMA